MAVDPTSTAISIHVRVVASDSCASIPITAECTCSLPPASQLYLDMCKGDDEMLTLCRA